MWRLIMLLGIGIAAHEQYKKEGVGQGKGGGVFNDSC
jgi:hypothetical protein